jgi:hypothetical protein
MKHDYGERDIATPRAALDDCIAAAHRLLQFRIPLEQPAFQLRWFFKQHRQDGDAGPHWSRGIGRLTLTQPTVA